MQGLLLALSLTCTFLLEYTFCHYWEMACKSLLKCVILLSSTVFSCFLSSSLFPSLYFLNKLVSLQKMQWRLDTTRLKNRSCMQVTHFKPRNHIIPALPMQSWRSPSNARLTQTIPSTAGPKQHHICGPHTDHQPLSSWALLWSPPPKENVMQWEKQKLENYNKQTSVLTGISYSSKQIYH